MSTLTTVPQGTTTFKSYDKPRYSKAKRYINLKYGSGTKRYSEICSNCHQSYGKHYIIAGVIECPEYQILNK